MAINVSVQYNGGLLFDITVDPMLLPSRNPFKCHEDVLYLQPMIPPKRFDIFSPDCWGMLRWSRRVQISLEKIVIVAVGSHIQRIVLATEETTVTQQVSHA